MPDPEARRAAQLLATHALPLLGLALAVVVAAIAAAAYLVRTITRSCPVLLRTFGALVERIRGLDSSTTAFARGKVLVPSAYVALHLAFGLVVAAAVAVFAAIGSFPRCRGSAPGTC